MPETCQHQCHHHHLPTTSSPSTNSANNVTFLWMTTTTIHLALAQSLHIWCQKCQWGTTQHVLSHLSSWLMIMTAPLNLMLNWQCWQYCVQPGHIHGYIPLGYRYGSPQGILTHLPIPMTRVWVNTWVWMWICLWTSRGISMLFPNRCHIFIVLPIHTSVFVPLYVPNSTCSSNYFKPRTKLMYTCHYPLVTDHCLLIKPNPNPESTQLISECIEYWCLFYHPQTLRLPLDLLSVVILAHWSFIHCW